MTVLREHLAVVSAVLTATCVLPYLRDIRRGRTRPQRASWFVFATLSIVATVSQFASEAGPGVWLSAGSAAGFLAVFLASIRTGEGGFSRADRGALAVGAIAVASSLLTGNPLLALVGVILAEIAAITLTVRKTVRDPDSETVSTWLLDGAAGLVAIAAVDDFNDLTALLYPIHHTLANLAVVLAVVVGRLAPARQTAAEPTNRQSVPIRPALATD